jgi:hypothetical protein
MCNCICNPIFRYIYHFFNIKKCEICNKNFLHKTELSTHIKTNHPEIFVWGSSKDFFKMLEKEKLII